VVERRKPPHWLDRYHRWSRGLARDGGAGVWVAFLVVLFALAPFVLAAVGLHIASFDAWAAAMHRGRPLEAWARAAFVLALFMAFAFVALRRC
jgi:hypothetical protein